MKRMKSLKKFLAIFLCVIMVTNNTLPLFAESNSADREISESEVLETEEVEIENLEGDGPKEDLSEPETEEETETLEEPEAESETGVELEGGDLNESEVSEETLEETQVESLEESTTIEETETTNEEIVVETIEDETSGSETETSIIETTEAEATESETTDAETEKADVETETNNAVEETTEENNISTNSEIEKVEEAPIASLSELDAITISSVSEIVKDLTLENNDDEYKTGFFKPEFTAPIVVYDNPGKILRANPLPSSYDSRDYDYIPPVRNQSPYGSCWAFSTIVAFEASLVAKGLVDKDTINLSEAALMYNTYGLYDVTAEGSTTIDSPGVEGHDYTVGPENFADYGGNQAMAIMAASSYMGVVQEDAASSYDRLSEFEDDIDSYTLDGNYAFNKNTYVLENAYFLNKKNRDLVKQKIMENGAVAISYHAGQSKPSSAGGDSKFMHQIDGEYYYYTNKTQADSNHAIAIVGWDDTKPASYFYSDYGTHATNNGGWLCRNSWGASWELSNGGYFWMSYDEPSLDDDMYAVDAIKAGTYKYNYHYDTTGYTGATGYEASSTKEIAFANIFKVPDDEDHSLEAVQVGLNSTNMHLDILVYTSDTEMANPRKGTLQSTKTVDIDVAGFYTIPLDTKVTLERGTYYSIIVRGYSSGSMLYMLRDNVARHSSKSPVYYRNAAELGQSFVAQYTPSTSKWTTWSDINKDGLTTIDGETYGKNWRIKGLANPLGSIEITFDNGGGSGTMKQQYIVENKETKLNPNKFTKTGYKFLKWQDQSGNEYEDEDLVTLDSNITLTATWTPITYTITYNANGGTVSPKTVTKTYDTNVTLATPTKTGYTFANWYKESTFKTVYNGNGDISTEEGKNVTIYAKWTPITYTITYDANGGTVSPATVTKTYDTNVTLATPTKTGYKFVAWYKENTFTTQYNGTSDLSTTQGDTKTIYAKWEENEYTITYNLNDGKWVSGYTSTTKRKYTVSVDLPSDKAEKTGHDFDAWYSEATFQNVITNIPANTAANKTVYAKWIPKTYNVTFETNGGTIESGDITSYTYGVGATLPTDVTSPDASMEFAGWYETADFSGSKVASITTTDLGDKVYYARYSVSHIITFEPGEGTGTMSPQKVYEGDNETKLDKVTFTKSGYTFSNWTASNGNTYADNAVIGSVTEDLTLVANWSRTPTPSPGGGGTGGSGGGGGGGGGGRISTDTLDNGFPTTGTTTTTYVNTNKSSLMSLQTSQTVWIKSPETGKWYLNAATVDGQEVRAINTFVVLTGLRTIVENNETKEAVISDTYFFNESGEMVTGWVETSDKKWYFFDTAENDNIGKMALGWKEINGSWYYFSNNGDMYQNTTTPDGFKVDENGKWVHSN